jgi:predicted nucleic acid-binding protein
VPHSVLVDTNILIDHLRGKPETTVFFNRLIKQEAIFLTSVITRIELLSGLREAEEQKIKALLSVFREIPVDLNVAEIAGKYMNLYMKSNGLNTADAIIAATVKSTGSILYTLNGRHFPMADIQVDVPY